MTACSQTKKWERNQVAKDRWVIAAAALLAAIVLCLSGEPAFAAAEKTREAFRLAEEGLGAVGGIAIHPWGHPYFSPWWGWNPYAPAYPPYPPYSPYGPYPYPSYPSYPPAAPGGQSPYPVRVNPAGRLLILVNPVDAEVYVDGIRLQRRQDLSYEVGLLAGPHQVDVKRDGYKPFSQKLDIPPGGGVYLPIALEK